MMDNFAFRLVQYGNNRPPEIRAVCKRCLAMCSCNDVFGLYQWLVKHDCKQAIVANFTGIPKKLENA